jgi:hypothetical protein
LVMDLVVTFESSPVGEARDIGAPMVCQWQRPAKPVVVGVEPKTTKAAIPSGHTRPRPPARERPDQDPEVKLLMSAPGLRESASRPGGRVVEGSPMRRGVTGEALEPERQ